MNNVKKWRRNRYGNGKRAKAISISLPADLFQDIEADRGKKPRSTYISEKLLEVLNNETKKRN